MNFKAKIKNLLLKKRQYTTYLKAKKKAIFFIRKLTYKVSRKKDGTRRWCFAPWNEAVILCDGTVLCGCALAYSLYSLGNIKHQTFAEIWNGKRYIKLRKRIIKNPDDFFLCRYCDLNVEINEKDTAALDKDTSNIPLPKRLHIEPTVVCNLRCSSCVLENLYADRKELFMDMGTFKKIIDEMGKNLSYLGLFNYGETFIHPQAIEMIKYAKSVNDKLFIHISTNGHFFKTPERQEEVLRSGVDELLFSIDGACQEIYSKYRINGDFNLAYNTMKEMVYLKKKLKLKKPKIIWRYILFSWNDSDEEMNKARRLAKEAGVDRFCWLTTTYPADGISRRFVPGTGDYESIKDEIF